MFSPDVVANNTTLPINRLTIIIVVNAYDWIEEWETSSGGSNNTVDIYK